MVMDSTRRRRRRKMMLLLVVLRVRLDLPVWAICAQGVKVFLFT
jgi:hypothetical protein